MNVIIGLCLIRIGSIAAVCVKIGAAGAVPGLKSKSPIYTNKGGLSQKGLQKDCSLQ